MAQDIFRAECGCSWDGGQQRQACAAWRALVAGRERLEQGSSIDYEELGRIDEQMAEHTPPWMEDERA